MGLLYFPLQLYVTVFTNLTLLLLYEVVERMTVRGIYYMSCVSEPITPCAHMKSEVAGYPCEDRKVYSHLIRVRSTLLVTRTVSPTQMRMTLSAALGL